MITCSEKTDLLALLCVLFSCVLDTLTYDVPGQVLYLIVSIPDLCLLLYFLTRTRYGYDIPHISNVNSLDTASNKSFGVILNPICIVVVL